MGKYLLRSMLYVPAYNEKLVEKSLTANADALIYDLEDSVPQIHKKIARENVEKLIHAGMIKNKQVFVRVNALDSQQLTEDLRHVLYPDVTGLVLPKINTAEDMESIGRWLGEVPHYYLQNFVDSGNLIGTGLSAFEPVELEEMAAVLRKYTINVALRGI